MLIFIDTEFTGLNQPDPKLISLALVPADGRDEFYAEVPLGDGWSQFDCSPFVRQQVMPLLWRGKWLLPRAEWRTKLLQWFAARPRSCQIAADSETDFRFLRQVLGDTWPGNLAPSYFDLRGMIDSTVFDHAAEEYYSADRKPHHALHDARANRRGWLAYCDSKKPRVAPPG